MGPLPVALVTPERYHEALCRFEPPLPLSGYNYEQAWHIR